MASRGLEENDQTGSAPILTPGDRILAEQSFQDTLETKTAGQSSTWRNDATGVAGTVTPIKTWKTRTGTYCRSYREKVVLATGKSDSTTGTACRTSAGIWKPA
nr:RT0821/Lpp0805 family surface protein [Roseibium denhamense]